MSLFDGISSVLRNKCPRCHKGQFFVTNNPYNFKHFDEMNRSCSHCGESFMREPGFYIGAMYISYAISVGLTGIGFWGLVVALDVNHYLVLGVLIFIFITNWTLLFRLARLIWINLFVKYDPTQP